VGYDDLTPAPTLAAMPKPGARTRKARKEREATQEMTAAREVQQRVGQRMRKLRKQRELSQEVMAARIGISQKYLSELERGQKSPSWDTLVDIAHKGFEIKLAALMFGVDEDVGGDAKELSDVLAGRSQEVRYDVLRAVELILRAAEASK
jgi:transcriptional regulator with XRE-family HTH domain